MGSSKPAGDSSEQLEAELQLVRALEKKLSAEGNVRVQLTFNPKIELNGGSHVKLDAYCELPRIFCEVWAHLGRLRGSQPDKVMSDALKLLYVSQCLGGGRCILVFADPVAARPFAVGKSWMASCLKVNKVEAHIVPLPKRLRQMVEAAQQRQSR